MININDLSYRERIVFALLCLNNLYKNQNLSTDSEVYNYILDLVFLKLETNIKYFEDELEILICQFSNTYVLYQSWNRFTNDWDGAYTMEEEENIINEHINSIPNYNYSIVPLKNGMEKLMLYYKSLPEKVLIFFEDFFELIGPNGSNELNSIYFMNKIIDFSKNNNLILPNFSLKLLDSNIYSNSRTAIFGNSIPREDVIKAMINSDFSLLKSDNTHK